MNHHSSTIKKYYPALVGAALIAASLFQFSRPVFSAGTAAGTTIRNTATGTYKDDAPTPNTYTIDSNTVNVTVARVAGITNIPSGITDKTTSPTNTSVLTNDEVSFEFTITNVGNHKSNIYIPGTAANIQTNGLSTAAADMTVEVSQVITAPNTVPVFAAYSTLTSGIVPNVPANGKVIVRVTSKVTATAAGAPIEVRLGDTGSNTDPNIPVADTQNQFDHGTGTDAAKAMNEVRTEEPSDTTVPGPALADNQQKEASSVEQVFLGSNPVAMTKMQKTRVYDSSLAENIDTALDNNVITYNLDFEVLTTTPNSLFTPGKLEGRNFGSGATARVKGSVTDASNLILVSDAIPANTEIQGVATAPNSDWTPVYAVYAAGDTPPVYDSSKNLAADQLTWTTVFPASAADVKRVGWVYDARTTGGDGPINPGTTVTGFSFNVVTKGLTATGGTVANIAQVFGSTVTGPKIFDESGDQDPSNFTVDVPGPSETASGSTGIANPAGHTIDSDNNNNATGSDPNSPGGEDNVITINKAGDLLNGPDAKPAATGNLFVTNPDNNHDFQNKGISNFNTATCTGANTTTNRQDGKACKLDPAAVIFDNTLSNPGTSDLKNVLLQPINPGFNSFGGTDGHLPPDTKVTINLGTQQAIYKYTNNKFVLEPNTTANPSVAIKIPTLAAGVPLDYKVTVDLPPDTELSTDLNRGFAVPIIAFVDNPNLPGGVSGAPDPGENSNYTVNQVYTGFIEVSKQVKVMRNGVDVPGMGYANDDVDKQPRPGDVLVYRVNYRNISEPQAGNGNNLILNGKDVMIDENGTQANITGVTNGNNWGLDNNGDLDLDTINVQNAAVDSNGGTITYYTGTSPTGSTDKYSVNTLTSAGTTDPGDTVTGYRSTVKLLAPAASPTDNSTFIFQRKVDGYDGLAQEGLD